MKKVVWLSANKFGYELLKEAIKTKKSTISSVITLSDKSKTIMYDGIERKRWHDFGIKVYEIENINEEKDLLEKLDPDFVIVCGWRQIIKKEILNLAKCGFIGFHPTLLPKGRGPAPIINTIISGESHSGLTMFYLTESLDNGDIIGQEKFRILETDHAEDVHNKATEKGKKLIRKYFPLLIEGKAPRKPQDNSKATYFEKPELKNNEIDLKEPLDNIFKKIKALSRPYKGAYIKKDGKKLIIWKAGMKKLIKDKNY